MFQFKHVDPFTKREYVVTIPDSDSQTWPELTDRFFEFLRGCSYIISPYLEPGVLLEEAHREVRNNRQEGDVGF
jgi:hypothetical protein